MIYPSGTPTKPEIIAIALSKIDLRNSDVFADIGCGSGSVSIAASKIAKEVYAIDSRTEAITAARRNFEEAGVTDKIRVIEGEASDVLPDIPYMDCAFIGGTRNFNNVFQTLYDKARKKLRIAVSVSRIETVVMIMQTFERYEISPDVTHIQVSKGTHLAGGTMFKPENPVYVIAGEITC